MLGESGAQEMRIHTIVVLNVLAKSNQTPVQHSLTSSNATLPALLLPNEMSKKTRLRCEDAMVK